MLTSTFQFSASLFLFLLHTLVTRTCTRTIMSWWTPSISDRDKLYECSIWTNVGRKTTRRLIEYFCKSHFVILKQFHTRNFLHIKTQNLNTKYTDLTNMSNWNYTQENILRCLHFVTLTFPSKYANLYFSSISFTINYSNIVLQHLAALCILN
jgi:uncharacterized protein YaeQ